MPPAPGHSLRSPASLSPCRMETFPAVAEEVLREFQVLLQHSPPPIGSTRMLQLVAINMFAVYNSQPKGTTCCSKGARGWGAAALCRVRLLLDEGGGGITHLMGKQSGCLRVSACAGTAKEPWPVQKGLGEVCNTVR